MIIGLYVKKLTTFIEQLSNNIMRKKILYINRERLTEIALFLFLVVAYVYTFPRWADPNQNSRLDMVFAIVEDGTFQIDKYVQNTVDYAKVGDHYYSDKAPGTAFLGVPFYAGLKLILDQPLMDGLVKKLANNDAFKATLREGGSGILVDKVRFALAQVWLTFLIAIVPSAFIGVLLFRLLKEFTNRVGPRLAVALGYGLFTPAFAYAGSFYGHQLSAALLISVFYLVFYKRKSFSTWRLLGIGFLLGLSVITEYPSALIVGILYLYTLYVLYRQDRWTRIGWVTLSGGLVAIALMVYNAAVFGGPFTLGYSDSTLWQAQHHTGFMSLTFPYWDAFQGITFSQFRGLFFYAPISLLAIPGFVLWWRSDRVHRAEFWVALSSVATLLLFNSSSIMWWGGYSIGPRYLLPMLPFMFLPIVFVFLKWADQGWFRFLSFILFGWSFVATWGLTLAEQAFPPDYIFNPLLAYAWPNWAAGNIARNIGTVMDIPGVWSLVPLFIILSLIGVVWWLIFQRVSHSSTNEKMTKITIPQPVDSSLP